MAKVGRPRIFETPEEFAEKAEEYFTECDDDGLPYTITGLVLHLGFADRQSLYDYQKRDEFSAIVKRARLVVESSYELSLATGRVKPTGPIFALKNMGWSDRQEVDFRTPDGVQIDHPELDSLSVEDLKLLRQLQARAGIGVPSTNGSGATGNGSGS